MNYRWIDYSANLDPGLKARYEEVADRLIAETTEPIAICWAHEGEDWDDTSERNCLIVTQHAQLNENEMTFGKVLQTIRLN